MKELKMICTKCGKEAVPDKDKSNKNWTVYKSDITCPCGGVYKITIIDYRKDKI